MAGINVPQYEVFKIGTEKLAYNNWDLTISREEAFLSEELVMLFEAQEFRLISQILNRPLYKINFKDYICLVVIEKMGHFKKVTSKNGVIINGNRFKRFVGTTGGLKNNSLLMVNAEIYDELSRRVECGRNADIPLVPAKYEAYKALSCSASQKIISPRNILVVRDCITKIRDSVITLDNGDPNKDSPDRKYVKDMEIENTVSDGFNLCTYDFMMDISEALGLNYTTNGVCLRNAWLKGMLYPFPIIDFFERYHLNEDGSPNYYIEDIWGNTQDIRECDMIVTESSLKLWSCYSSIEEYMDTYRECGFEFSVTKISPHELDNERELNYQYIQSYNLDDEDIAELCDPTIKRLKDALCGDYQSTLDFIGAGSNDIEFNWQRALQKNKYMLKDPYIIDCVHRMIKKKIDQAKIGKLFVTGNYQIALGDPYALMQSICGLEVTGLLGPNECYSSYWNDMKEEEVVIFRSPMTCHNNIRKCRVVNNPEVKFWYQYIDNCMIINGWDTFCQSENGCDWDGDILFSTNNAVLKRKHITMPAIICAQSNTQKVIINEENVKESNKNGMGNQVGTITNRVTAMMEVQARFSPDTEEWKELEYRIECGQLYQQDEIDKIKGIVAKPMPNYWYSPKACDGNDFLRSIAIDKKPYFMIYVYEDYKKKYKKYIDDAYLKCYELFNCTLDELRHKENQTEEERDFLIWFEKKIPFGMSECAMNKVCFYVESQMNGYKIQLKKSSDFDYNLLKKKRRCTKEHREKLEELCSEYVAMVKKYKESKSNINSHEPVVVYMNDVEHVINSRKLMQSTFKQMAEEICPNDDERLNIVLDMCYQYNANKQFCWDVIGELICKRLEEMNDEGINS